MKFMSMVLLCFFVSACSSTKVHLYTRYLSDQETRELSENLEKLGLDIVTNSLAFPEGVDQSTLLYSPFVQGENSVNLIIDSLDSMGWTVANIKPIFAGNHYYTKNSVGLLLLPQGVVPSDKVNSEDIANVYESKACETSINLKLNSDGSYQFLYLNKKTPQSQQLTGRWQMTSYPYIELISVDNMWRFYYEIEKNIITDVVGKIDLIELKPVDDHYKLPKCRFAYGLRK